MSELVDKLEQAIVMIESEYRERAEREPVWGEDGEMLVDNSPPRLYRKRFREFDGVANDVYALAASGERDYRPELPQVDKLLAGDFADPPLDLKFATRLNLPGFWNGPFYVLHESWQWVNTLRMAARIVAGSVGIIVPVKQTDVAKGLGLRDSEVQRLCEQGLLRTNGEAGTAKRICEDSVIAYARSKGLDYTIFAPKGHLRK